MRTHLATLALLAAALPAWAGSLDAPAAPASGSGMPSTTDIYNRLDTGATVSVPGTFQEPAAGPTAGTGRTLADIAAKLPVPDNTQGAAAGDVANGKTFWGLRTDGTWGPRTGTATQASGNATSADVLTGKTFSNGSATGVTGTMVNNGAVSITPGTSAQTIPAGYHNGAGSVAGDPNLRMENIKQGVAIFGQIGSPYVVNTGLLSSDGPATASDIAFGKKAWVNGMLVVGTSALANNAHIAQVSCTQGWGGANCNVCAGQWTGANCDICPSGWSGVGCDILSKPFGGSPMPTYLSTPWKCVYDTATGLTWEVKTTDGSLHDWNNTYTWYSSRADAVDHGTETLGSCKGDPGCDTEKLVFAANFEQWCGYTNWRLPTFSELSNLYDVANSGFIDTAYFPNTPVGVVNSSEDKPSTPSMVLSVKYQGNATPSQYWSNLKSTKTFVRLVRGTP